MWLVDDAGAFYPGDMADLSSHGIAFTLRKRDICPQLGQQVEARFFCNCFEPDGSHLPRSFTRIGHVCHVEKVGLSHRIAMQFAQVLPLKPGEPTGSEPRTTKEKPLHVLA